MTDFDRNDIDEGVEPNRITNVVDFWSEINFRRQLPEDTKIGLDRPIVRKLETKLEINGLIFPCEVESKKNTAELLYKPEPKAGNE